MDINGKNISKQKRPNSPPCQMTLGFMSQNAAIGSARWTFGIGPLVYFSSRSLVFPLKADVVLPHFSASATLSLMDFCGFWASLSRSGIVPRVAESLFVGYTVPQLSLLLW